MSAIQPLRRLLDRLPHGEVADRLYLLIIFVYAHRRMPRRNSGLFNDYLFFLKSSPAIMDICRQITSDKILVKRFIDSRVGEGHTIATKTIFHSVDEIILSDLERPCVIKPAHASGNVVFVDSEKQHLRFSEKEILENALKSSPYQSAREANYRYLRPRLICEPMLRDGKHTKDYKFFCYNGQPRIVQVDSHRQTAHRRNLYRADWSPLNIRYNFPVGEWEAAPERLSEMLKLAKNLSSSFEFVRVDFFVEDDSFYIGELTHCPESAHGRFGDIESEQIFSDILFSSERG